MKTPFWKTLLLVSLLSALSSPATAAQECPSYSGPPPIAALPDGFIAPAYPSARLEEVKSAALAAALDRAQQATGAPAIGAAVLTPQGSWSSGDGEEVFFWASVTKLVTASVIMQLVEEGAISLDSPIAAFVPGVPEGDTITIRMLLDHTSGLGSANEIVQEQGLPFPTTLDEELAIVAARGMLFCPGSHWRYSNTGYALLGAVIEAVDGGDYAASVQRRVSDRLGLSSMRVVADPADDAFAPLAPAEGELRFHPSQGGPAGSVVATPADMARLLAAILHGDLFPENRLMEMTGRSYPMFSPGTFYGMGMMAYRFPGPNGQEQHWVGHSGGVPGAKAILAYDQASGILVAAALTGNGSAEATANLLVQTAAAP